MTLIGIDDVREQIDAAEVVFSKSYDRLLSLKHTDKNLTDALFHFQAELAECLYSLMAFYQRLISEKRGLIESKDQYNNDSFRKYMKNNHEYGKTIKKVIEIGKSLGDAFAWIFYWKNGSELFEHLNHKSTGLFVANNGGLGEIEFIKANPMINGLYVVYHGITSMLRIGDFSLVDMKQGVVAIGELKTVREGDHLSIQVVVSSKYQLFDDDSIVHEGSEKSLLDQSHRDHLEKQVKAQDSLLSLPLPDYHDERYTDNEHGLLNAFATGRTWVSNLDNSLFLFNAFYCNEKLSHILLDIQAIDPLPQEVSENVKCLFAPKSGYDHAFTGYLDMKMTHSRMPLFWWDIDETICRDIYFHKRIIATIYNPAKLLQYYINKGFALEQKKGKEGTVLKKKQGKLICTLSHFDVYFDYISHGLMKTSAVTDIIDTVIDELNNRTDNVASKIEIKIMQRMWKS